MQTLVSIIDQAEIAALAREGDVGVDELVARIKAAPDMGGKLIVELSEFMETRAQREDIGA